MTKQKIITEALKYGYRASYSGRSGQWTLEQIRPSGNTRAFDGVVFQNLIAKLGIDGKATLRS